MSNMHTQKRFFQFVIPSVLAFALSGVYAIVDGYFVGNSLGDTGLAAINLAYPLVALLQALGTGLGLAGAIRFTILAAQGRPGEEKQTFSGTVLLLLVASALSTGFLLLFGTPVLRLLGADGEILSYAQAYMQVFVLGAAFQIFGTGLIPFIRNIGGATFAMVAMITGFLTNILLDYLFVWVYGWGMAGAALATVIGEGITLLCAALYLLRKKIGFKLPPLKKMRGVLTGVLLLSLSPFGLTFSPNITIILMNRFLVVYGGDEAVAIFACIAYITSVVYLLLQGIGDGCQPLLSRYHGENAAAPLRQVCRLAYGSGAVLALGCMAALFFAKNKVGLLFGASAAVSARVAEVLPLFLCGFVFLAFVRITTAQFYATEKSRLSYLLVYAEPVLLLALLFILPPLLGVNGVWVSVPLAQIITAGIAVLTRRKAAKINPATLPKKAVAKETPARL